MCQTGPLRDTWRWSAARAAPLAAAGKGGIEDIKFHQIKAAGCDVPKSKFIASAAPVSFESLHAAARTSRIGTSSRASSGSFTSQPTRVDCNGVVKNTLDGKAVVRPGHSRLRPGEAVNAEPRGPAVTPRKAK